MLPTPESTIRDVLENSRTIALVGASHKPERPSYGVMRFLINHGYVVYPVNPGLAGQQLQGRTVYADLAAIPDPIDMVDIFRASDAVGPVVEDSIRIGAKSVWMQLGVINDDAARKAHESGLKVVVDRCPAIEIPRLWIAKRG